MTFVNRTRKVLIKQSQIFVPKVARPLWGGVLMYAVLKTGGKQYRVQEGDVIFVEKLNAEVESTVELTEVLAVSNGENLTVGAPLVSGAKVVAKVAAQGKAKKITVFKYKPKKDYRKKTGHRQPYTKLVIEKIEA